MLSGGSERSLETENDDSVMTMLFVRQEAQRRRRPTSGMVPSASGLPATKEDGLC
jgi:hypothetical protein